jgi:flagellar hook-associated protein 1 FlgK
MPVNTLMSAAVSGLQTAQTALTTVSDNITNVNTPGYVREVVEQNPVIAAGQGIGVTVDHVQRITDTYLEGAAYNATSTQGSASIISDLLSQAQAAFGDPSRAASYLNQLTSVFGDFAAAANDPASNLPRSQTIDDLNTFLDSTQNVADTLTSIGAQTNAQIGADVGQINQLLSQIETLNTDIAAVGGTGANVSGSQDSQSKLLGQLASLMQINVSTQGDGSVVVRSATGQLLVGYGGAATLAYTPSVSAMGVVTVTSPGQGHAATLQVGDGELQGLVSLNNTIIPGVRAQLAQYVSGAAAAINAAHNANTAVPPPQTLSGRNTGLDLPTIVGDFSGKTNIAVVGSNNSLQQQVTIDFSAQTMSVNAGPATAFTPATFLASLNTALGGAASASFTNGALSISATAAGSGVAIADDATTPAQDGGQGFSQFFGLNDLITSSTISNYNTGLKSTDASGLVAGGVISFQIANASGTPVTTIPITVPPTGFATMQTLLNALNAPIGGVGQFGSFSLDSKGALSFAPNVPGASLGVASDTTQRGAGGPSLSQLFGVGVAQQAARATSYSLRPDIDANPANLALAKLDLTAAPGTPVVAIGDGSGAAALSKVASAQTGFGAAGTLPGMTTSVSQYAANLAGALGQQASAAANSNAAAKAVQSEAQTRLQSVEGVNLDEELVNLTTYQQAYNASARLIQASAAMINTLLDVIP